MKPYHIFIAFLFGCCMSNSQAQTMPNKFDPKNTYCVIVGVLKWEDKQNLPSFEEKHRKDLEFKNLLLKMGVPEDHLMYLQDEKATLANIHYAFEKMSGKSNANSTFLFYFAGHGIKQEKTTYFANYDVQVNECPKTGFEVAYLSKELPKKFKGKNYIFLADCCYSGALLEQGKWLGDKNNSVIVYSSATASNTSTGNWTFSQVIIDAFSGMGIADRNNNKKIDITDISTELNDAMQHREHQLCGSYSKNVATDYSFAAIDKPFYSDNNNNKDLKLGQYAYGLEEGYWKPVRIVGYEGDKYLVEFYFYSDKKDVALTKDNIKIPYFVKHKQGDMVQVVWEKKKYAAQILKVQGDFYYIHYTGYGAEWDEWVMYDRIGTGKEKKVQIEEKGTWYPGEIMEQKGDKYYIRYDGYDFSWDEWVGKNRLKF